MQNLEPIYSTTVRSDQVGNWMQVIEADDLSPGMHRVVIENQAGESDEAAIFVVQRSSLIDRATMIVPPVFMYAMAALGILILFLLISNIYFGQKADKQSKKKSHFFRNALIISILVTIATGVIGVMVNQQTGAIQKAALQLADVSSVINVEGSVIKPFENTGIEKVDLTVGDTSIKTSLGGHFSFQDIQDGEGIRLNHADLRLAYSISAKPGRLDIPFDVDLFNKMFDIMQYEVRGQTDKIFLLTAAKIRNAIREEEFINQYKAIFSRSDATKPVITVKRIETSMNWKSKNLEISYPQVISMDIVNYPHINTYSFVFEDGDWKLIF